MSAVDVFTKIDTEEKAYWLGFLYADGSLYITSKTSYRLDVVLSLVDKSHLDKICVLLGTDCKISGRRIQCRMTVYGREVYDLMKNYMFNPTGTVASLNSSMYRHYIRGFFDGDGSVYINKHYNEKLYVKFACQDYLFLDYIRFICNIYTFMSDGSISKCGTKNCYTLQWGGNSNAFKFYRWLYHDAAIYLNRKRDIFMSFLGDVYEL